MSAILRDPPPPIESTARGGDIPAALCRVVERCLDKTPDGRFQSTEDLAFALKTAGTESGLRTAITPPAAPLSRGSIWRIAIVAALGLITGAAGAADSPAVQGAGDEIPVLRVSSFPSRLSA